MSAKDLKIGSTVWVFDESTRVYRRNEAGRNVGSPLRRPMWVEWVVVAETVRSWVVVSAKSVDRAKHYGNDPALLVGAIKIPKAHTEAAYTAAWNGYRSPLVALTAQAVEDDVWLSLNKHKLLNQVMFLSDARAFRVIADLIGYVPEPEPEPDADGR